MKKLILGIVMFLAGMSKFVDIYNISTLMRAGNIIHRFSDFDFLVCTFFGATMFIIGIAGLFVAASGVKEKKTRAKAEQKPE